MRTHAVCSALVAAAIPFVAAGCGQTTTVKTVVETVSTPTTTPAATPSAHHRRSKTTKPATSPTTPAVTNPLATAGYRACDAQITAKIGTTTCGFAENAFYEYWTSGQSTSIDVYSPTTDVTYPTDCTPGEGQVVCSTTDDGSVKFSQNALDRYSQSQADSYAANHDLGPASGGTSSDTTPASPDAGANQDVPSYSTPSDPGPNPSNEIPNYPNGTGTVVQCSDGQYSHSGGRPGACSGHGGVG